MSSSCLSDIFIIWSFFKALLIPCEIPVYKPAKPIVDAIFGATDLTNGRAI